MAPFLKTLHTEPQNAHNMQNVTHLAKANTFLRTILTLFKMVFLRSNSTLKLVLGGIPVRTEYRCLFLLRYDFFNILYVV